MVSRLPPKPTLFPYTTLFRSRCDFGGDADPLLFGAANERDRATRGHVAQMHVPAGEAGQQHVASVRSEEHTSELQSHSDLVCRLLLEKKKNNHIIHTSNATQR